LTFRCCFYRVFFLLSVGGGPRIARQQPQRGTQRLSHEDSIERIAVQRRKAFERQDMSRVNVDDLETGSPKGAEPFAAGHWDRVWNTRQRVLDGDLPPTNDHATSARLAQLARRG